MRGQSFKKRGTVPKLQRILIAYVYYVKDKYLYNAAGSWHVGLPASLHGNDMSFLGRNDMGPGIAG